MLNRTWRALAAICPITILCLASREPAPEYRTIPAATIEEMTPAAASLTGEVQRDWGRAHADNESSGYSSLRQITRDNVRKLAIAWTWHSGDLKIKDNSPGLESNPVIVDGVLYGPTVGDAFVALNATTGYELWRFKPEGQPAVRGLVFWRGDAEHGARLYFSSGDWLYAVEAKTGKPVVDFGEKGRVAARSTVAPVIYRNIVVIPCWNVMRAFDLLTGQPLWHFDLIANSSPGLSWGANSWGGMALDEGRGIGYVSTGSPHPNFLGMNHPGDDLYADSVIALRMETGEYLWHFQEVRHDVWDWDIPAPPNLVTVTREGRKFDAVAQVTKIGNTLLLDRVSGKPLFPVRMRRAPVSDLPGETLAEWQPDMELPEPFVRRVFSPDQITDLSSAAHAYVAKKIANARYGWFLSLAENKSTIWYSSLGGAEWTGASFDPESERLFVNANDFPCAAIARRVPVPAGKAQNEGGKTYAQYCAGCHGSDRDGVSAPSLITLQGRANMTNIARIVQKGYRSMPPVPVPDGKLAGLMGFLSAQDKPGAGFTWQAVWQGRVTDQNGYPGVKPPWGTLNAINLNTGRVDWKVPLGEYEELTKAKVPATGTENFAATIVTAGGIIFCAGTPDRKIRAFDSKTGAVLWQYKLPFAAYAQPSTYEVNGRQYVAIAATGGGKLGSPAGDVYIAFALP
jgi:quinoprotein glucose dehydrogenase